MLNGNSREAIEAIDQWLDAEVGSSYKDQPLAQHWARVAKTKEEKGEAIAELILWTAQNPRKPFDASAKHRMLCELADEAITAILAIQHFTKDRDETDSYIGASLSKAFGRALDAGYGHDLFTI